MLNGSSCHFPTQTPMRKVFFQRTKSQLGHCFQVSKWLPSSRRYISSKSLDYRVQTLVAEDDTDSFTVDEHMVDRLTSSYNRLEGQKGHGEK